MRREAGGSVAAIPAMGEFGLVELTWCNSRFQSGYTDFGSTPLVFQMVPNSGSFPPLI